jgi:hypothetical protein
LAGAGLLSPPQPVVNTKIKALTIVKSMSFFQDIMLLPSLFSAKFGGLWGTGNESAEGTEYTYIFVPLVLFAKLYVNRSLLDAQSIKWQAT